jgi:hypothetical protein
VKYFALTNDPDHGKTEDYRKILKELAKNSIFVTTAVFCKIKEDESLLSKHCHKGDTDTLDIKEYRELMLEAKDLGHEIAFHGYSQVSDTRDEFQKGLEIFNDIFGEYPKVYFEHGGHPKSHNKEMIKKENLAMYGSDTSSEYYIRDIVKNVFNVVWTHDYLRDELKEPLPLDNIFDPKDGLLYLNRWRMFDFIDIRDAIDHQKNTIVGYTHFGYRGYKRSGRNILLNAYSNYINKNAYYERWLSVRDMNRSIKGIKDFLVENNVKSVVISELYDIYIRSAP